MFHFQPLRQNAQRRSGFTLVELLVVFAIISILLGMTVFALAGASKAASRRRTRTQVAKIHESIAEKWESYETRSIPSGSSRTRQGRNRLRLDALRELMKYEMPDRVSDLFDVQTMKPRVPVSGIQVPSVAKYYMSKALRSNGWTPEHQGAECLYLILSRIEAGDGFALDAFPETEIGDTDGDGMFEILDAFRQPMQFVRWPAGYTQVSAYQDPLSTDPDKKGTDVFDFTGIFDGTTYRIFPLIFSVGPDGKANILRDGDDFGNNGGYAATQPFNNPYTDVEINGATTKIGSVLDTSSDAHVDNITNHALGSTN